MNDKPFDTVQLSSDDFLEISNILDREWDDELPPLSFLLSNAEEKSTKSLDQQLEEIEVLKTDIELREKNKKTFLEDVQNLKNSTSNEEIDVDSDEISVSPIEFDKKVSYKIFGELQALQFFCKEDLLLSKCGYDKYDIELTPFEKELLLYSPAEIETVISSISSDRICSGITKCKSFITYLLRTIAICVDKASIKAYENLLKFIIENHPGCSSISFSFIEDFCPLLLNYGVNTEKCPFMEIKGYLPEHNSNISSDNYMIPEDFEYNIEKILNFISFSVYSLKFQQKDLKDMFLCLLWVGLDDDICGSEILCSLSTCFSNILRSFDEDAWIDSQLELVESILSVQISSVTSKWEYIYQLIENIPYSLVKGNKFRKLSSLNSLRALVPSLLSDGPDKNVKEFNLEEMKSIVTSLHKVEDANIVIAVKLIDICFSYLKHVSETIYEDFCQNLKQYTDIYFKNSSSGILTHKNWARLKLDLINSRLKITYHHKDCSLDEIYNEENSETMPEKRVSFKFEKDVHNLKEKNENVVGKKSLKRISNVRKRNINGGENSIRMPCKKVCFKLEKNSTNFKEKDKKGIEKKSLKRKANVTKRKDYSENVRKKVCIKLEDFTNLKEKDKKAIGKKSLKRKANVKKRQQFKKEKKPLKRRANMKAVSVKSSKGVKQTKISGARATRYKCINGNVRDIPRLKKERIIEKKIKSSAKNSRYKCDNDNPLKGMPKLKKEKDLDENVDSGARSFKKKKDWAHLFAAYRDNLNVEIHEENVESTQNFETNSFEVPTERLSQNSGFLCKDCHKSVDFRTLKASLLCFFRSIIPMLESWNDENKVLEFQTGVLQLIKNIMDQR